LVRPIFIFYPLFISNPENLAFIFYYNLVGINRAKLSIKTPYFIQLVNLAYIAFVKSINPIPIIPVKLPI